MLCENCKEREATVHFTEIMNGRVQKHHLCKECAAQMEICLLYTSDAADE